jgi:DNA replication initiation complex subunit (GINS family)
MISYADLERAYRLERVNPTLQKIPESLYDDARRLADNPDAGDYRDIIKEYIGKLHYHRCNKIIHYAGRASPDTKPPDNILPLELALYRRIFEAVADNKAQILQAKLEEPPQIARQETVKVRLKSALPAIAGADSREYGPFREDEVVELPMDIASILLERKAAEKA